MARSKKKSLLGKFANWIKGSIEKFANEGFSKEGQAKRKKAVPSFLRIRKKRAKPTKKKSAKKKAIKKISSKKPHIKKISSVKNAPLKSRVNIGKKPVIANPKLIKQVISKPLIKEKAPGILVGKIAFYFEKAKACAFKVENAEIKSGAKIRIMGSTTDFKMTVKSIQINRIPVPSGRPGEDIGIGVTKPVTVGDSVYLV